MVVGAAQLRVPLKGHAQAQPLVLVGQVDVQLQQPRARDRALLDPLDVEVLDKLRRQEVFN